jgi:hypothetical protein
MGEIKQATWIKFFALLTAVPRWAGALLAAEGFEIPTEWLGVWVPASAFLAMGMAVTEAWAFSYVFTAWRNQTDKRARNLFIMAVASALIFVLVLAPYVRARVAGVSIDEILSNSLAAWLWATAVAASTISIIITVGYAQRKETPRKTTKSDKRPVEPLQPCWCGFVPVSTQSLSAHSRRHKNELKELTSIPDALNLLAEIYPGNSAKPADIRKLLKKETENEKPS